MSESKGALIAKTVQKHAGRAKEKLLQNLGKVDRTLDDIFEEHLQNFNRQHQQATRLQKEFNNYIRCVRAVQTASKSLMEAITEVYESGWSGHDLLYVQSQNLEVLWQDFSHKLGDQVLIPLNTYTNQFPETRKKIEKRGRKLVDYDSQRHSFQNLQANAAKRRDDVKVTRGREQLEEAKRTYEVLNSELHDELPALHDSRVLFHVTNLQTLFAAEQLFHSESAKVFNELEMISDKLATECQRGAYSKRSLSNNVSHNNVSAHNTLQRHNGGDPPATATLQTPNTPPTPTSPTASAEGLAATFAKVQAETTNVLPETPAESPRNTPEPAARKTEIQKQTETIEKSPELANNNNKTEEVVLSNAEIIVTPPMNGHKHDSPVAEQKESPKIEKKSEEKNGEEKTVDEGIKKVENDTALESAPRDDERPQVYDVPVGATVSALGAGALYRVRATYRYVREDDDELSFDVGDLITVVNYDDPDEQEEGWLMGIKDGTNEKGMFPANFTRRI